MDCEEQELTTSISKISNTNCHTLLYGSSGSGKTSFLKHYLDQTKHIILYLAETVLSFMNKTFSIYYS